MLAVRARAHRLQWHDGDASSTTLRVGDTTQFSATVTGNTNQTVTWSVNGVPRATRPSAPSTQPENITTPHTLPTPNSVKITAASVADKSLFATSSVTSPESDSGGPEREPDSRFRWAISRLPSAVGFVSGSTVMFGGTALTTTYVSRTQLTATGTATSAQVPARSSSRSRILIPARSSPAPR